MGTADWPARVCRDIQHGAAGYFQNGPVSTAARIYHHPGNRQMATFVRRLAINHVRLAIRSIIYSDIWGIGVVDRPIHAFLEPSSRPAIHWLPRPPRHRYWADPFAVQHSSGMDILVEEFDYTKNRGSIVVLPTAAGKLVESPLPVMRMPHHLSYPYLVRDGDELYCLPEMAQAREQRIFKCVRFPDAWEDAGVLIRDLQVADATIFFYQGRWWLFHVRADYFTQEKLYAWYSERLLGPWIPHPLNPLKTDVRSARPGGTPFEYAGALYRPAQDSAGGYGCRVVVNRVLRLTPTEFQEEVVSVVEPDRDGPFAEGAHTLSAAGDWTVTDGRRSAIVWVNSKRQLQRKARKLFQ
jgi:hypothetical protein